MVSSEMWGLIYVVVGGILGFAFSLLSVELLNKKQNEQKKREYLGALFDELDRNKKLIDNDEIGGYDTSAYTDAKVSKYLFDLPRDLKMKINEAQIILINAQLIGHAHLYYSDKMENNMPRLKILFNEIIPEFNKYIEEKM